jgi:hypothetical protein
MNKRKQIKYIHEGKYAAEVDVELIEAEDDWGPYLSLHDAYKLDDVRDALRRGDLKAASKQARLFIMQPIAI